MNQKIRAALCEMGYDEAILFDGPAYDEAILGVTDEGQVVYDYDGIVRCLMEKDGMTEDEAIEYVEYNVVRAIPYAGEYAPILMHRLIEI